MKLNRVFAQHHSVPLAVGVCSRCFGVAASRVPERAGLAAAASRVPLQSRVVRENYAHSGASVNPRGCFVN